MFFILLIFSIPVYIFGFWGLYEPEESYLFLDRWRYKEIPELSDIQIKLIKIGSVVGMILWTLLLIYAGIETFTPDPPLPTIGMSNY
ncbi:hypothetical protein [Ornithinibacillus californiensis]|uniref:hypothetical protein n=1 Tax=Ornithinibacillus californiensis TaxID=161536 RepID=UPI00069EB15F|nr:hypothetical protein [Ornithinibacillus californiensis]